MYDHQFKPNIKYNKNGQIIHLDGIKIPMPLSDDIIEELRTGFIAIDTETTGLSALSDDIIEIGATLFVDFKLKSYFQTFINIGRKIPRFITHLTNITDQMLIGAPQADVALEQFLSFIDKANNGQMIVVGHNFNFDMRMLNALYGKCNNTGLFRYVDTMLLARRTAINVCNHKQETLAHYYHLSTEHEHRADFDATLCGHILINLIKEKGVKI